MNARPTIFVVDDDVHLCNSLSLALRDLDYDVECFSSAEGFLATLDPNRPGCVVLDVHMEGMTGLEMQQEMLRRRITLPIIFVTGYGEIAMATKACRHGAIDFLEKPVPIPLLTRRIDEALEKDEATRKADAEVRTVLDLFESLTEREVEVMTLVVAGSATATSREIAHKLGISFRTVETYRARLMVKMHARSISDLVGMAKVCGIYRPQA